MHTEVYCIMYTVYCVTERETRFSAYALSIFKPTAWVGSRLHFVTRGMTAERMLSASRGAGESSCAQQTY